MKHLIKTETGYAIVERIPGPYTHSAPSETVVLELTDDDMTQFGEDMRVAHAAIVPPVPDQPTAPAVPPVPPEKVD